jgi:hypothetical protein
MKRAAWGKDALGARQLLALIRGLPPESKLARDYERESRFATGPEMAAFFGKNRRGG